MTVPGLDEVLRLLAQVRDELAGLRADFDAHMRTEHHWHRRSSEDIAGALGTVFAAEQGRGRAPVKRQLLAFLAVMGPGIIAMVGDNDAGGVATYTQAGVQYGYTLLWTLVLLIPVLIVNQEMVVRLGAVTRHGHAAMINARFGRFWGWFSIGDLLVLNFLTIATEFIGVALGLSYFGVSRYASVPVAAVLLIAITVTGSLRRWERAMFAFITLSFIGLPLLFFSTPHWGRIPRHLFVPGVAGGVTSASILLIIAIVGTTVAPWQLFFQQSNVIDKNITRTWLNHERADTALGSLFTTIGALALMVVGAEAVLDAGASWSATTGVLGVAHALQQVSSVAGALLAVLLVDASVIGAGAVTLATSYACGDFFGTRHTLNSGVRDARVFYATYTALTCLAASIVLIPHAPLGLVTEAVQALSGLLLPSASVFLLMLCNDRAVLGPWVNPPWLNAVAAVIIGTLLCLSGTLMATTLFPGLDAPLTAVTLACVLAAGLGFGGLLAHRRAAPRPDKARRADWVMPPLEDLPPVAWTPALRGALYVLRGYLVIAAVLLLVKVIQLAGWA